MKKIFLIVALIATVSVKPVFAQEQQSQLSPLLSHYYGIKNALVNSNAQDASAHAGDFTKAVGAVDMKALSADEKKAFMSTQESLASESKHIADNKDIAKQREYFAGLSADFFKLAKAVKLTGQPVYYDYCPMKKSYWLTADAAIKNPYFGNQMPTCGKITETLNK
ncbi:MAG: DUF3347 domain-containing protein [Bacteroidetes bacterium]|nr:DUF3347 domain-containing protein [Bacteroidota bacterium]